MKRFRVDIQLESFNYDHIRAKNEDEAVGEAISLIEERYPWAEIASIKATEIEEED